MLRRLISRFGYAGRRCFNGQTESGTRSWDVKSKEGPKSVELDANSGFVSVSGVKQCLMKNNLVFTEGYTCLSIDCLFCSSKPSKLYINKITGFFTCHGCNRSGNWVDLEPYVKDRTESYIQQVDERVKIGLTKWLRVQKHLHRLNELSEGRLKDVLKSIGLPDLSLAILNDLNTNIDIKNGSLYFPLTNGDSQIVGYKVFHKDLKEDSYPLFDANGVLKRTNIKNSNAVLVHTVVDFLGLCSLNIQQYDVICLPHGHYSLPQSILPLLEDYKKVVLWFGKDTTWDSARQFAKKLSEKRCHLVRPVESQKSVVSAMENNLDVPSVINDAQKIAHTSITTFSSLREDIIAELYNADKVSGVKWERFPLLTSILKGHRRGELTILTGPTGSGKTTFMSEYSLDLAMQKVTTLWGSFEIRNQRLARTMLTQMVQEPLIDNLERFDEWADRFEQYPIYFMTFHGQQPLETVMEAVKHASYVHDVAHVIIDNVQFMLGMTSSESGFLDRFYRQDALIGGFRNFATTHNCHVTLVIHPRKEKEGEPLTPSSIFGGAKASQEADNILIIQNRSALSALKVRKFLQIAKNRFSGDLGMMPLDFDKESLSFMPKN